MTSNSNNSDQLMQQTHPKQTKLTKFLRTIDPETLNLITQYLRQNPKPSTQNNSKPDKIKLYHDLLIVHKFKNNENSNEKMNGSKKKVDVLCRELAEEIGFSAATIKERIQKKLAGVSREELREHIRYGMDFSFNTKKKLVPIIKSNQDEIFYSDGNSGSEIPSKQSKKQPKVITINSSGSENEGPMYNLQEIGEQRQMQMQRKDRGEWKRYRPREEVLKERRESSEEDNNKSKRKKNGIKSESGMKQKAEGIQNVQEQKQEQYNQFRNGSDHESDQEILIVKEGDSYLITTAQAQSIMEESLGRIKQNQLHPKKKQQKSKQKPPHRPSQANPNHPIISLDQSQPQPQPEQPQPTPQQLSHFSSLNDWKLAQLQPQKYEHLKWHKDEDQFLSDIVAKKSVKEMEILKKYKDKRNILDRIRWLGLEMTAEFMMSLVGDIEKQ